MATIDIRIANPTDVDQLPAIERLAGDVFRAIPVLAWIADDEVLSIERHQQLIALGATWVAAADSGKLVGFLSAEPQNRDLHIWQLAVLPHHQKQGIGRRLLEKAREWGLQRNCDAMTLTTFRRVPWNDEFYSKCGFRTLGEDELPPRLRRLLAAEEKAGLDRARRCAMVLRLSQ